MGSMSRAERRRSRREEEKGARPEWATLEEFARLRLQGWLQDLLYRFPKDLWTHLRTSNPVESPFSAVRLRTDAARRYKKVVNAEASIWKILLIAEKKFRRLNSPELLEAVHRGQQFVDGIAVEERSRTRRAA